MKQLYKIRYISAMLSLVILFGVLFSTVPAFASEIPTTPQQERERHAALIADKVQSIETKEKLKISAYKSMQDFNGNPYVLIECEPVGYLIYHPESAQFVEYAADSPSPFLGIEGDLLYGGPTQYYYKKADGSYQNTLERERVLAAEDLQSLASQSDYLQKELIKQSDTAALEYTQKRFVSRAAAASTQTFYITQSSKLSGLDKCGYYCPPGSGGICGYIAAAMMLYYYDVTGHRDVMDDKYYYNYNGKKLSAEFTKVLLQVGKDLGYGDSTTSVTIHYTVKEYLKRRGITSNTDHTSRYTPLFTFGTIGLLLESNQPVIIFGNLYSPSHGKNINHAVLAYGYHATVTGNKILFQFIVHFGYDNYRQVTLSGVFGSIYSLKC